MRRSRPRSQLARLTVQPGLSDRVYFLGLRALGAAAGGELHPLVFLEAAETVSLDGGVVNEDVGGAVVGGDETVTLVGVKPLHCALSHCASFCCDDLSRPRLRTRAAAAIALSSKAGLWNLRRRCQNFAGAVTRTRTSTTTKTSKHHHANPACADPPTGWHSGRQPGAAGVRLWQQAYGISNAGRGAGAVGRPG